MAEAVVNVTIGGVTTAVKDFNQLAEALQKTSQEAKKAGEETKKGAPVKKSTKSLGLKVKPLSIASLASLESREDKAAAAAGPRAAAGPTRGSAPHR